MLNQIGDCLVTFVKTHEISLLPFDEIQQFINRLWVGDFSFKKVEGYTFVCYDLIQSTYSIQEPENRNEERNIGVCIFHVVAKRCQANSIRQIQYLYSLCFFFFPFINLFDIHLLYPF